MIHSISGGMTYVGKEKLPSISKQTLPRCLRKFCIPCKNGEGLSDDASIFVLEYDYIYTYVGRFFSVSNSNAYYLYNVGIS